MPVLSLRPCSYVGMHTGLSLATKVWVPKENPGSQNNQRLGIASGHVLTDTPPVTFFLNAIDFVGNQSLHFVE